MELKANLNLTLSKVIEEGKVLIPVFGQDLTGMENLGNTCYMNSVVQVLFSLDEFKNFFIPRAISHIKNSKKFSPECIHTQIGKLALGLHSGHYS
jgi:ubiquitin carboxyl-terminal hydrolase 5/13